MSDSNISHSQHEWNNNGDGTYWSHNKEAGMIRKKIPSHPRMREIYDFAYHFACDNYCTAWGTFEKCFEKVEEKFGKMSEEMRDYILRGPWDAGDRAGLLIEEPDHYE